MGKFSIRQQIFILAAAFLVGLGVVSYMAWTVKATLTKGLVETAALYKEAELIEHVQVDLRRAELALLAAALQEEGAWDTFLKEIKLAKTEIQESRMHFSESMGPEFHRPELEEQLGRMVSRLASLDFYYYGVEAEAEKGETESINTLIRPELAAVLKEAQSIYDMFIAETQTLQASTQAAADRMRTIVMITVGVVLVGGLGLCWWVGNALRGTVVSAAEVVRRLSEQDYDTQITGKSRKDEIGGMSRNLETLRDKLDKADKDNARAQEENNRRVDLFQNLGHAMSQLKSGHLDSRMTSNEWQDLGESYVKLCDDFNGLAQALEDLVGSLRRSSDTVKTNATDLSEMSSDMSHRAEVQAATLEESAAALEELSNSVASASEHAKKVELRVSEGRKQAQDGGEVMRQALEAMSSIAKSSEQITKIIDVIDDIAFQTNLLALNAGVEAARAGESGKGFAVVASEVRGLAQRAAESANAIKDLVLNSTAQVEDGEQLVQRTSEMLGGIVQNVTEVSDMVSTIAKSATEQSSGVQQINVGVAELDQVTQQNAAMVGETNAASQQLNQEAVRLADLLAEFTGGNGVAVAAPQADNEMFHDLPEAEEAAPAQEGSWDADMQATEPAQTPQPMKLASGDSSGGNADWSDF